MEKLINPEVPDKRLNRRKVLEEILKLCKMDKELANMLRLKLSKVYDA
jgi:hypothetical protein